MSERFPGAFSDGEWKMELPSVELLVTDSEHPLDVSSAGIGAFEAVGLARRFQVWKFPEWPAIRLALPDLSSLSSSTLTIACKRTESFAPDTGYGDEQDDSAIANFAVHRVQGLGFQWAMVQLLVTYRRRLASFRDVIAKDREKAHNNQRFETHLRGFYKYGRRRCRNRHHREIKYLADNQLLVRMGQMQFFEVESSLTDTEDGPADLIQLWSSMLSRQSDDLVGELRNSGCEPVHDQQRQSGGIQHQAPAICHSSHCAIDCNCDLGCHSNDSLSGRPSDPNTPNTSRNPWVRLAWVQFQCRWSDSGPEVALPLSSRATLDLQCRFHRLLRTQPDGPQVAD